MKTLTGLFIVQACMKICSVSPYRCRFLVKTYFPFLVYMGGGTYLKGVISSELKSLFYL